MKVFFVHSHIIICFVRIYTDSYSIVSSKIDFFQIREIFWHLYNCFWIFHGLFKYAISLPYTALSYSFLILLPNLPCKYVNTHSIFYFDMYIVMHLLKVWNGDILASDYSPCFGNDFLVHSHSIMYVG
jgi:hypothetical protein